ncbi:unnamed protein product [Lactuca virosa]|uniref:GED domain-containing protein n=1 Tax=Lactuca virosa TaxID=75947 RepID=A0AAU9P2Y4_9ASTR|nr:unnamed protein product [Lactuca virosa]
MLPSIKKACLNVMLRMKEKLIEMVIEMIEMEKVTDYTCDPDYIASWNKLMGKSRDRFLKAVTIYDSEWELDDFETAEFDMEGYGTIRVEHLFSVPSDTRNQAFDLTVRVTAYWNIVLKRMVDWIALELRFGIHKMVNKEMEKEIVYEVMVRGGVMEKMLEEPTSVAAKRERLQKSISLLQESKEIINQAMDGI